MEKPPIAVQEVALVEDHVRIEDAPLSIVPGLAERLAVGGGAAGATVMRVHTPQLLVSPVPPAFDSVIVPVPLEELLSAHTRR